MLPLIENAAGASSWPVSVPLKPRLTVPPLAAMVPFQLALVTVTVWPDWVQLPFQPEPMPSPASGQVKVSVQLLIAVAALLVRTMEAPKPPGQLLLMAKWTAQEAPAGGGTVKVAGDEGSDGLPWVSTATTS